LDLARAIVVMSHRVIVSVGTILDAICYIFILSTIMIFYSLAVQGTVFVVVFTGQWPLRHAKHRGTRGKVLC
jgi:uncharacterized metal-binding protein